MLGIMNMISSRIIAAGLALLGVVGLSATVSAQRAGAGPKDLGFDVFSLRLLLGVGDDQVQDWGGLVRVDKGEIVDVEGWRFRKDDRATGKDSWAARSLVVRKVAEKKPGARPKGPSSAGPRIAPNGVLVTVKAPADATLSIETAQGNFTVALAALADGS